MRGKFIFQYVDNMQMVGLMWQTLPQKKKVFNVGCFFDGHVCGWHKNTLYNFGDSLIAHVFAFW